MYVETVPNRNSRPAILLREGRREGTKVRKRTLANLTDRPIALKRSPEPDRVVAMIVERPVHPASKLATTRLWHTTTLAGEPDLGDTDEDAPYRAMDRLAAGPKWSTRS